MSQNSVEVKNLHKIYLRPNGERITIFENFQLNLKKGKIYSMIGNSGSGKSTLVNMIGGFEEYNKGQILLDGGNDSYKVGILFQNNILYPWKNIMDNMLFACNNIFEKPEEVVRTYLKKMNLANVEKCYPDELSGGMQQRIALLRILLTKPDLVILDEAFGALDFQIREQMQDLFLELHKQYNFTAIVVTHDLSEAIRLGDRILVMYGKPLKYKELNSSMGNKNEDLIKEIKEIFSYDRGYINE